VVAYLYSFVLKVADKLGMATDKLINLMIEDVEFIKIFNPILIQKTTET